MSCGTSGVYVVEVPRGLYVGESSNIEKRARQYDQLGLVWRIARRMPNSSKKQRLRIERWIADLLELQGHTIVSRNTTEASRCPPERRTRIAEAQSGKPRKPLPKHQVAQLRKLRTGKKANAVTRAKLSANTRATWANPTTRAKRTAGLRTAWARRKA